MSYVDFVHAPEIGVGATRMYFIDIPRDAWKLPHEKSTVYTNCMVAASPIMASIVCNRLGEPLRIEQNPPNDVEHEILIRVLNEIAGINLPLVICTDNGVAIKLPSVCECKIEPAIAHISF